MKPFVLLAPPFTKATPICACVMPLAPSIPILSLLTSFQRTVLPLKPRLACPHDRDAVCQGLADRQAADAVRGRINWQYAFALELTDPGVDASVLCDFRARLISVGAEQRLFETMLVLFKEQGLFRAKGRQHTDASHVLAAVHVLNQLECIGETLCHAFNSLPFHTPDWLRSWVPPAGFERYSWRIEEYRPPDVKANRYALSSKSSMRTEQGSRARFRRACAGVSCGGRATIESQHAEPCPGERLNALTNDFKFAR